MTEYPIDLSINDQVIDLPLAMNSEGCYHMVTWTFTSEPVAGASWNLLQDRGDGIWIPVTERAANRKLQSGVTAIFPGPVKRIRFTTVNAATGAGAVLRLWSLDQYPENSIPSGVFAGTRAITIQSYTEVNVKTGRQYEVAVYQPALAAGANSDFIVKKLASCSPNKSTRTFLASSFVMLNSFLISFLLIFISALLLTFFIGVFSYLNALNLAKDGNSSIFFG